MNRPIKFRAWWKDARIMVDVISLRIKGSIEFFVDAKIHNVSERIMQVLDEPEQYVLMQYTGLKDKNGEEIYEGDLVSKDGLVCEVAWHKEGRWGMKYKTEPDDIFDLMLNDIEVIGNIYENPNLLEK